MIAIPAVCLKFQTYPLNPTPASDPNIEKSKVLIPVLLVTVKIGAVVSNVKVAFIFHVISPAPVEKFTSTVLSPSPIFQLIVAKNPVSIIPDKGEERNDPLIIPSAPVELSMTRFHINVLVKVVPPVVNILNPEKIIVPVIVHVIGCKIMPVTTKNPVSTFPEFPR